MPEEKIPAQKVVPKAPKRIQLETEVYQVVNQGKDNHFLLAINQRPFAEVSGETIDVLGIDACSYLNKPACEKRGLNPLEIEDHWRVFKEKRAALIQQNRKEEVQKLEAEYFNKAGRVRINFGREITFCILAWMAHELKETDPIYTFNPETLRRIDNYKRERLYTL